MSTAINWSSRDKDRDKDKDHQQAQQAAHAKAEELEAKANDAASQAKHAAEDVASQAKDAAADAGEKTKEAAAQAQDHTEGLIDQAKVKLGQLKETAAEKADNATGKAEEAAAKAKSKAEDVAENVETKAAEVGADHAQESTTGEFTYEKLKAVPDLSAVNRKIFLGALPLVGTKREAKGDPTTALEVDGVTVDQNNLASYTSATGLRLSNEIPPTYFFVVAFPMIMELMSRPDFPVPAVGAVHVTNIIEQARPLTVDESFTVRTHGANLRPHRRGLLMDLITEVFPDGDGTTGEPVWKQTSTFLAKGAKFSKAAGLDVTTRGEDSGKVLDKPELPEFKPNARWRWNRSTVNAYVEASNDHNPIHTSNIGAKLFGFPAVIAHGMLSAAAVLAPLEGKLPGALRYSVEFVKPVVIPTEVAAWIIPEGDGSYGLQLRSSSKPEKLHLNAELKAL